MLLQKALPNYSSQYVTQPLAHVAKMQHVTHETDWLTVDFNTIASRAKTLR